MAVDTVTVMIDLDLDVIADQIVNSNIDRKRIEQHIISIDLHVADVDFTASVINSLLDSLVGDVGEDGLVDYIPRLRA